MRRMFAALLACSVLAALPNGALAQATLAQTPAAQAIEQRDFFEILHGTAPQDGWAVYEWSDFPGIYIIHYDTYALQALSLNRIAMYVERRGHRGTIPDASVKSEGVYAAHDYRTSDLAEFFNEALAEPVALLAEEQALLDWLAASGLLLRDATRGGWRASGRHALLSFATRVTAPQPDGNLLGQADRGWEARALYHETRHGLYFTRPSYRERCLEFWNQRLSPSERRAVRLVLGAFHYDPSDEELMVNEWMAYLLTPDFRGIGPSTFAGRLRMLATRELAPAHFTSRDFVLLERAGPALASRIEGGMVEELQAWLGGEWDIPRYVDVAAVGN